MPTEFALTVAFLFALLRSTLRGRRNHRGRRIFRNRHGVLFRGRFRRTYFHPRRHVRRNTRGRRIPNRRRGRQGHGGRRHTNGSGYGRDLGLLRHPGGDPGAGPSTSAVPAATAAGEPHRDSVLRSGSFFPFDAPQDARLPTPTPTVEPQMAFGTPVVGPSTAVVASFTAATNSTAVMPSTSTTPSGAGSEPPFFLHLTVPAGGSTEAAAVDDEEEEDPEEVTASSSPSPPRRNPRTPPRRSARMRVGGRGRPNGRLIFRSPPTSPEASGSGAVATGSEATASGSGAVTLRSSPNGGRVLRRMAAVAESPSQRPGRAPGAWASTARPHPHSNGVGTEHSSDNAGR